MEIILSTSSHEPYYAQISRQIQQLILSGQLHPGDALVEQLEQKHLRRKKEDSNEG